MPSVVALRLTLVGLVVAAAVVGSVAYVTADNSEPKPYVMTAAECRFITDASNARNRITTGHGALRVTVLGDSYAQGGLLETPGRSWPAALARPLRARVAVSGFGGTGFGPALCGPSYANRAAHVMRTHPDLIIIQGGLNDIRDDRDVIAHGFRSTLATFAGKRVVLVGPTNAPTLADGAAQIDAFYATLAAEAGIQFVSTIDWTLPFLPDGIHLTQEGHDTFGRLVAEAVKP